MIQNLRLTVTDMPRLAWNGPGRDRDFEPCLSPVICFIVIPPTKILCFKILFKRHCLKTILSSSC